VTNFIISETIGKIKQDQLDDVKRTAAKCSLIPLIILFAGFSYFLRVKFILQDSEFFIISGIADDIFFCFIWGHNLLIPKILSMSEKRLKKAVR
jgi:hypothetical protein